MNMNNLTGNNLYFANGNEGLEEKVDSSIVELKKNPMIIALPSNFDRTVELHNLYEELVKEIEGYSNLEPIGVNMGTGQKDGVLSYITNQLKKGEVEKAAKLLGPRFSGFIVPIPKMEYKRIAEVMENKYPNDVRREDFDSHKEYKIAIGKHVEMVREFNEEYRRLERNYMLTSISANLAERYCGDNTDSDVRRNFNHDAQSVLKQLKELQRG